MNKTQVIIKVESTNSFLSDLLSADPENTKEGLIVMAHEQTGGRGQGNNSWHSEKGKNLLFSLLLEPNIEASEHFYLNMAISMGVVGALEKHGYDAQIKWPNDIYTGGKKLAGILMENTVIGTKISHSIVGIGLNVNQMEFPENLPNPTSLAIEKKPEDLMEILCCIREKIFGFYSMLKKGEAEKIKKFYLERLYLKNRSAKFKNKEGEVFEAAITGVKHDGKLELKNRLGEELVFNFKEISFLGA